MTEKSLSLAARGWYTFQVDVSCNKAHIAQDIERLYKVDVTRVRTIMVRGKSRRVGRKRTEVKKSDWKKALVQVKEGQTIDAFEVSGEAVK